jgi:hypothetical protein
MAGRGSSVQSLVRRLLRGHEAPPQLHVTASSCSHAASNPWPVCSSMRWSSTAAGWTQCSVSMVTSGPAPTTLSESVAVPSSRQPSSCSCPATEDSPSTSNGLHSRAASWVRDHTPRGFAAHSYGHPFHPSLSPNFGSPTQRTLATESRPGGSQTQPEALAAGGAAEGTRDARLGSQLDIFDRCGGALSTSRNVKHLPRLGCGARLPCAASLPASTPPLSLHSRTAPCLRARELPPACCRPRSPRQAAQDSAARPLRRPAGRRRPAPGRCGRASARPSGRLPPRLPHSRGPRRGRSASTMCWLGTAVKHRLHMSATCGRVELVEPARASRRALVAHYRSAAGGVSAGGWAGGHRARHRAG